MKQNNLSFPVNNQFFSQLHISYISKKNNTINYKLRKTKMRWTPVSDFNKVLLAMITLRILSGLIELTAACLMYYFNKVETAIRINAVLGIVGPVILIIVTFLGLIEISHQLTLKKLFLIFLGVCLIFAGTY